MSHTPWSGWPEPDFNQRHVGLRGRNDFADLRDLRLQGTGMGACDDFLLRRTGSIVVAATPGEPKTVEANAATATGTTAAEGVVFKEAKALNQESGENGVFRAEDI